MIELEKIFGLPPYGMKKDEKTLLIVDHINRLNSFHSDHCEPFKKIQKAYGVYNKSFSNIEDFLYIPVSLFKDFDLKSVAENDVIKILTSSGTTSSKVSRIFLDKFTSRYQTKALSIIIKDFIGPKRLPMLIVDSQSVFKDRSMFSARGAGILGMSNFGRDHLYLLDDNFNLKLDDLRSFLEKFRGENILIFGFTYIVWLNLYEELKKNKVKIDLEKAILVHSGGWKKLLDQKIDNIAFKSRFHESFGIKKVHNFYGMVEQVGSVFMECENGYFHSPSFSEIIIRNPKDWSPLAFGKEGVVEVLSILPYSYPGHVLLTEDMGTVYGEDDCECGKPGKYFKITGRIPEAEIRGCSDTYEQ
jgi:phenylacetate-coenzyme A ligase PaaK-like adenylate-forming protein